MAIAQMFWGRMLAPMDDPAMADFTGALDDIYRLAETHPGFIWRISDAAAAEELAALGHDALISATVSVWETVESLRSFVFDTVHADMLERRHEWFVPIDEPRQVIWDVPRHARPGFAEAFARLERLKEHGPHAEAYGWS